MTLFNYRFFNKLAYFQSMERSVFYLKSQFVANVAEGVNELHEKYDVSGHAELLAIKRA